MFLVPAEILGWVKHQKPTSPTLVGLFVLPEDFQEATESVFEFDGLTVEEARAKLLVLGATENKTIDKTFPLFQ